MNREFAADEESEEAETGGGFRNKGGAERRPRYGRLGGYAPLAWLARGARRILVGAAMLLALFSSFPRVAWAGELPGGMVAAPRDVPRGLVAPIQLPSLPPGFVIKDTGGITFSYPSSSSERVEALLKDLPALRAKIQGDLGLNTLKPIEVRIGRTPEEMAALCPKDIPPPAYATGVAYPSLRLIGLSLMAPATNEGTDLKEVFGHELAHLALEDASDGHHVPLWFNEGLAVHESGEKTLARVRTLWDATLSDTVLPLADIDHSFPADNYEVSIAYAQSADIVRYLLRDADRSRFISLLSRVRSGQPFERALSDAYGTDLRRLEYEWRNDIGRRFNYWPIVAGGSLVWVLLLGAMVAAYVRRRQKSKETLARWDQEEAMLEMERRRRAEALRPEWQGVNPLPIFRPSTPLPKVEHEGRWHTLH